MTIIITKIISTKKTNNTFIIILNNTITNHYYLFNGTNLFENNELKYMNDVLFNKTLFR